MAIDDLNAARFEASALPHMAAAYNLARWLTSNDHDAEDLLQDALLRAFRSFHQLRGEESRAWLMRIVRNTFYAAWRDEGRHHAGDVEFDEEMHSLEEALSRGNEVETLRARADSKKAVTDALQRLPVAFREIVVLKEIEELSYKEIAQIADIPIGTVMSRLARGRKLLSQYLTEPETGGQYALHSVPRTDPRLR